MLDLLSDPVVQVPPGRARVVGAEVLLGVRGLAAEGEDVQAVWGEKFNFVIGGRSRDATLAFSKPNLTDLT